MGKFKGFTLMLLGAAGGAALSHFLDPDRGRARRAQAADQLESAMRSGVDDLTNQMDYAAGQAKGVVAERMQFPGSQDFDVHTLRNKVESEVLGPAGVPTGEIVVEVRDDQTVALRGPVASQELLDTIVRRTRDLDGVRDVESMLHLPGEPAPNIEPAMNAGDGSG